MKLEIEYVDIDSIKPYENNAKLHPKEQIEQIKKSIKEFGNNDPIAIWHNEIVEGHGRYEALKQLREKNIPIIRLDNLTDEQRKAYILVHNKLTMNSGFDMDILNEELDNITNIDMSEFGFLEEEEEEENPYSQKVNIPQYEIEGDKPDIRELYDDEKTKELIKEIEMSDVSQEEKEFLYYGAMQHIVFNYKSIAEYYAGASKEMQELMEKSALVIIDLDNAIANGYVEMVDKLKEMIDDEE